MVSRASRSPFAAWWWTVDRLTLAALVTIMLGRHRSVACGKSAGGSAHRRRAVGYFVSRHIM